MTNRIVYFLIGLPAAGKSTWRDQKRVELNAVVASSDDYIESMAKDEGKTYNEAFKDHAKAGETHLKALVTYAITNSLPVIWDQTNLSKKTRAKRLAMFPTDYIKIGVNFLKPPEEEWRRRLGSRPGKVIPEHVLQTMLASYEEPSEDEGFHSIINIGTFDL